MRTFWWRARPMGAAVSRVRSRSVNSDGLLRESADALRNGSGLLVTLFGEVETRGATRQYFARGRGHAVANE